MYLPTVVNRFNNEETSNNGVSSSKSSSSKQTDIFDNELVKMMKQVGLDNDMGVFINEASNLLQQMSINPDIPLTASQYSRIMNLFGKTKTNYDKYIKAEESVDNENAWSEVAVDNRGRLYIWEDNTVKQISQKEYDPQKHLVLTNQELLELRRKDPNLAFNTNIIDALNGAVGMPTILEYIKNTIKELGTTEITGLSSKQIQKIRQGIDLLTSETQGNLQGLITEGPDGIYKITRKSTIADEDLQWTVKYLLNTLPTPYQNAISAKATVEQYSPEALVLQMLIANTSRSFTPDYDVSATNEAFGRNDKDKNKDSTSYVQGTQADEFARGRLPMTTFVLSPGPTSPEDRTFMTIKAGEWGPIVDSSDKEMYRSSVSTVLRENPVLKAASRHITFGNQTITNEDQKKVLLYDGMSPLLRVFMPYTFDEHGNIKADVAFQEKFLEVLSKKKPGTSIQELKRDLGDYADKVDFLPNGDIKIKEQYMMPFATFDAYVNRDLLDISQSERYLHKLDRAEGRALKEDYNRIIQYGKLDITKNDKKIHDLKDAKSNDFYVGHVYLAITDSTQGFRMSNNEYYDRRYFMNVPERAYLDDLSREIQESQPWKTTKPTS